jgi:hypothetical protein
MDDGGTFPKRNSLRIPNAFVVGDREAELAG